jgi:quinol-cytochrome oxidoreductase complex cytochrome b subunit
LEKVEDEKVLVWPDLVYTELICMIVATFVLIIWAVLLKAPLEQPATSAKAPNPSKAPWYFLGLQEMLVYYDPWMAGVVLPTMIVVGLIAIPYIDYNQKGNGYFTFNERKFAITSFLFGFLVLWVTLAGGGLPNGPVTILGSRQEGASHEPDRAVRCWARDPAAGSLRRDV